jgi:hypothetical protein
MEPSSRAKANPPKRTRGPNTGAKTLQQPQQHQQDWCPNADAGVARDETDQESRNADQKQSEDEHWLAPDPVAEMTKHQSPERSREEADAETGKGREGSYARIELGEEDFVEHQQQSRI